MKLDDIGRLSLGCAPLGNLYRAVDGDLATATIDAAWERGVRLFDTAPLYGHGLSEERVGAALANRPRNEYLLATKVGVLLVPGTPPADTIFEAVPPLVPVYDFSADGVLRSIDASLERLGLDRIDLLHVHDPDDHLDQAETETFPTLLRLREEGVIGAVGVGTNHAEVAARFVGRVDLDCILLAGRCTLLDRRGPEIVFDACVEHRVRVLAAGVFNSGILAAPGPDARFDYAPAPPKILDRVERLVACCAAYGVPLAAAALQLPLRHAAVRSVIVGVQSPAEVHEDADLLDVAVPDELWTELEGGRQATAAGRVG